MKYTSWEQLHITYPKAAGYLMSTSECELEMAGMATQSAATA